jgi:hypothetical protein
MDLRFLKKFGSGIAFSKVPKKNFMLSATLIPLN